MDESNPLRNFTIVGRLWIIACIVIGTFAFIANFIELVPILPPGRYPILLFLVPVVLATLVLYAIGYAILRVCGLRLRYESKSIDQLADESSGENNSVDQNTSN